MATIFSKIPVGLLRCFPRFRVNSRKQFSLQKARDKLAAATSPWVTSVPSIKVRRRPRKSQDDFSQKSWIGASDHYSPSLKKSGNSASRSKMMQMLLHVRILGPKGAWKPGIFADFLIVCLLLFNTWHKMASVLGQLSKIHVNWSWIPTILTGKHSRDILGAVAQFCIGSGWVF